MNIKKLYNKKYIYILILNAILSLVISAIFYRQLGVKDAAMVFIATLALLTEIALIFIDRKVSLLLFIISFPLLVTARKICYFNFFVFKVTYETIYVTILFMFTSKKIYVSMKKFFSVEYKSGFNFGVLILLYILFAYNSVSFSDNVINSLCETYISILIPIMFMLTVVATFTKEDKDNIIFSLVAGIDLSCIYGFIQIIGGHMTLTYIRNNRDQLTFGYNNINIFASILTVIMPFIFSMILYRKNSKKERIFLFISAILTMLALLITFSRGALIVFIISIIILFFDKRYYKLLLVVGLVLALGFVPLSHFIISRGTSASLLTDESNTARILAYFSCIAMLMRYPFGIGVGNFEYTYKRFMQAGYFLMPKQFRWNMIVANYSLELAHNLWLQIAADFGIICAIVFLLIIINRIKVIFKNYKENRAAFTSIVVFIIFSIITGVEFDHKGIITGVMVLWLIFALIQIGDKEGTEYEAIN